ncbi:MAG: fibronectin type III domain-containing protein [Flavobacteriaceae bacterium]
MKIHFIFIAAFFLVITSCDSEPDTPTPPPNEPPTTPETLSPADAALCQNTDLAFTWSASTDPDGDDLIYQVDISETPDFSTIYKSGKTGSTTKVFTLVKGQLFYWRVKAIDSNDASSDYSTPWQFITEGDGIANYVPYAPTLVAPADYSQITDTSVDLEWFCEDLDGDDLSYDLHYGITEDVVTVQEDLNQTTLTLTNLTPGDTLFWKVVAHDSHGNSSEGKLWQFTIE